MNRLDTPRIRGLDLRGSDVVLDFVRKLVQGEEAMQASLESYADRSAIGRAEARRIIFGSKRASGELRPGEKPRGRSIARVASKTKSLAKRRAKNAVAKQSRKENRV